MERLNRGDTASWRCADGTVLTGKVIGVATKDDEHTLLSIKTEADRCPYPVYLSEVLDRDASSL